MQISPKKRIDLISKIGRTLQEQMTTTDINLYLGAFGIPVRDVDVVDSKWVYAKEMLADIEDDRVIEIAQDLEIDLLELGIESFDEVGDYLANPPSLADKKRNVFVIHGRDQNARRSMFEFLHSIDLKPLEWAKLIEETGKTNPSIWEILEKGISIAQAFVSLITPDDLAWLREEYWKEDDPDYEKLPTGQARANVLFETGLAMASARNRTVIVELGKSRPFSDISGFHTTRLDNSQAKRQDLAKRLEKAGCTLDLKGTDWHHAGDFELKPFENIISREVIKPEIEKDSEGPYIPSDVLQTMRALGRKGGVAMDYSLNSVTGLGIGITKLHLDYLTDIEFVKESSNSFEGYIMTAKGRRYLLAIGMD